MGFSAITAGRIYKGQQMGKAGEEAHLSFDKFNHMGVVKVSRVIVRLVLTLISKPSSIVKK